MIVIAALAITAATPAAVFAKYDDPEWPCIQRRVDTLMMGQMWAGPFPEESWREDETIRTLAPVLAQRRVSPEDVQGRAADFARSLPPERRAEALALLFEGILTQINSQRTQIIAGIGRYARRQAELSQRIDAARAEMAVLSDASEMDFDRMDALEAELDWDVRIFRERAQSLTYVCEAPVLLEQRAFAIARLLSAIN
ncbi:MAG: hypothetical protein EA339_14075 [Rhodobacteraceae bacterium]|nr:MAG: hypothetical protein EA339_14075 [Paracoccaceae bacterium]